MSKNTGKNRRSNGKKKQPAIQGPSTSTAQPAEKPADTPVVKEHKEQPAIQGPSAPTAQPAEKPADPPVVKEYKEQRDLTRLGVIILFFIVLAAVLLFYFAPLFFKVYFVIRDTPNESLDNYLIAVDRLLAWASLFLGAVSLYRSRQSDKLAEEARVLMRNMQSTVTELKWDINAANAVLQKMYTTKSEVPSASLAPFTGSVWGRDSVRRADSDEVSLSGKSNT